MASFLTKKTLATIHQIRSKLHFLSRTLNSSLGIFSENLQRTLAIVHRAIIHQHSGSLCKHQITTVKPFSTTVLLSFSHGSSRFELNQGSWAPNPLSIHHLEHPGASVPAQHGQKTSISSLFFKQGKNSIHTIVQIVLCFL